MSISRGDRHCVSITRPPFEFRMNTALRAIAYFFAAAFTALGLMSLVSPSAMAAKMQLVPASNIGFAEIRGLYGGGFIGFGLILLGGLHWKPYARGLLMAMALSMGSIGTARIVTLPLDAAWGFAIGGAVAEYLLAFACWRLSRDA